MSGSCREIIIIQIKDREGFSRLVELLSADTTGTTVGGQPALSCTVERIDERLYRTAQSIRCSPIVSDLKARMPQYNITVDNAEGTGHEGRGNNINSEPGHSVDVSATTASGKRRQGDQDTMHVRQRKEFSFSRELLLQTNLDDVAGSDVGLAASGIDDVDGCGCGDSSGNSSCSQSGGPAQVQNDTNLVLTDINNFSLLRIVKL